MIYHKIQLSLALLIAKIDDQGNINGLWFEGQKHFPEIKKDALWSSKNPLINHTIKILEEQLMKYEKGKLKKFDVKIEPSGTPFQKIVWSTLTDIEYGDTVSYGQVSQRVASKMERLSMSAQAVGSAISKNPISVIIPCHRVIGANGDLTGYAGGIYMKKKLLELEGVLFRD
jgi:methylated-DNA-[protein]-cysteine S-methyltransferase